MGEVVGNVLGRGILVRMDGSTLLLLHGRCLLGLIILLVLRLLLEQSVHWLNRHGDRPDDVKHVQEGDKSGELRVLWQVIQNNVLNQTAVGDVGEDAHQGAQSQDDDVGDDRLAEHSPWLVLLGVDVENANVALKYGEDFAHKGRQHRNI